MSSEQKKMVGLPLLVVSPVDVGRLIREIETIDGVMDQAALRGETQDPKLPRTSLLMDKTIAMNKLNLAQPLDRQIMQEYLEYVKAKAPVLHISFSADPSTAFLEKFMAYLRREIDPLVLLTIGLQPNIGAGCIVRSTNKYFDFSLKQDFAAKRQLLRQAILPAPVAQEATT